MTDIVQNTSLSFEAIRNDLVTYVQSLDDYETKWRDFYEGGAGTTVIELAAAVGTFLAFIALVNRREAYIDDATLTSSVIGLGTTVGYVVNRQAAEQFSLQVNCTQATSWDVSAPIGNYSSRPVSLLSSQIIPQGVQTLNCVLGQWITWTTTATTSAAYARYLIEDNVDNNLYTLTVNGEKVTVVTAAEDSDENTCQIRTYPTGVYLVFGDGVLGRQINNNDVIVFQYLQPTDVTNQVLDLQKLQLVIPAQTQNLTITYYGSDTDSNDKISAVAPGYYSTKRRLITINDYKSLGLAYQGMLSINARRKAGTCCAVEIAYLRDSGRTMLDTEKTAFINYMTQFAILGTGMSMVDPITTTVTPTITVVVTSTADTSSIATAITTYLNKMCGQLGALFSMSGLNTLSLTGVVRMYITAPIQDRQAAFNEYFVLNTPVLTFTTNNQFAGSSGTDLTAGYSSSGA